MSTSRDFFVQCAFAALVLALVGAFAARSLATPRTVAIGTWNAAQNACADFYTNAHLSTCPSPAPGDNVYAP